MKIHTFTEHLPFAKPYARAAFTAHGCDSLDTFRRVNGGDFHPLPEGHAECLPGFRPYRTADGRVLGVQVN